MSETVAKQNVLWFVPLQTGRVYIAIVYIARIYIGRVYIDRTAISKKLYTGVKY